MTELVAVVEAAVRERGAKPAGNGELRFRCPESAKHQNGDEHPSARWNRGKAIWFCDVCKKGGGITDLSRRLGIHLGSRGENGGDRHVQRRHATAPRCQEQRRIVATYPYADEQGLVRFEVVRFEPKGFAQRQPDGKGGHLYRLDGVRRVLYGLPQLLAADPESTVYITEGEKDADALAALGLVATTNPGGAGKWRPDYNEALRGRHVVILPDNDHAGRDHAEQVAQSLAGIAASATIITLPGLPQKGDVSDWLAGGGTRRELERLAADAVRPMTSFIRASDLVAEPDEPVQWLVDRLLPSGGLSIAVAKPKVGKSTLARTMAVAVAGNQPVLGRAVAAGPVLYLALEEKRADVRRHLAALGVTAAMPLYVHIGSVREADWLTWLRTAVAATGAVLVVVDPLARLVRVKDIKDYAELTKVTEPLITLAHETGAHVHCVHHARKAESDGADAVLGSTQLAGFVDTVLVLKRLPDGLRTLATIQRTGADMPESVITLCHAGRVDLGGGLEAVRSETAVGAMIEAIGQEALPEATIRERVGGDHRILAKALREAVDTGRLERQGRGTKGDPYVYRQKKKETNKQGNGETGIRPDGAGFLVARFPGDGAVTTEDVLDAFSGPDGDATLVACGVCGGTVWQRSGDGEVCGLCGGTAG